MTLPSTMSGVQLVRHGGPDALVWNDAIAVPQPGPGQVLVQVKAAGVNNVDINTRVGWYASEVTSATSDVGPDEDIAEGGWDGALAFPRIQGGDLCGIVVAAGAGVERIRIGQRVTSALNLPRSTADNPLGFIALGSERDGAFAQFCLMEEGDLHDVSDSPLSDIEIAAMPCAFGTAWCMLQRAGVGLGDHVLITGASGGVGMAAVQLAKYLGAQVTAVTSRAKAQAVRAAGADVLLDRDAPPGEGRFDAITDVVGGPGFSQLIQALKPGGCYVVSGAIAGPIASVDLRDIYLADRTISGVTFQPPDMFARLIALINRGAIRPLVSQTYPLADIRTAQTDFAAKTYPGKLVLIPPEVST